MSQYSPHARPACPGGSPNCAGFIAKRGSKSCPACAKWRHQGGAASNTPHKTPATPSEQMTFDRERNRLHGDLARVKALYAESLKTIEQQHHELTALGVLGSGLHTYAIEAKRGSGTSEATPVILASDWHTEEIVTLAQTNGLNAFNPEICQQRVDRFFQSSLRLVKLLNQDVRIETVVLALLGDFITSDLHEEAAETNDKLPIHALIAVQNQIASGIEFLLNNSSYKFVIPCKVGNHSRTTKKVRFSVENGHSLEHLMYVNLAMYFRKEPRVTFLIEDGYHQYLDIYGYTLRLHHGHTIKYGGGIGGLFIPAYKKISQWNKGRRADLDAFGHFHQSKDGGNFLCNGSLIGYNSFAVTIGADYEPPRQTVFLIDKKRGRTCSWPIIVENRK
jgi:hypothetical protein